MRERVTPTMLGTLFGVNPFKTVRKQFMIDKGLEPEFTVVQEERMQMGKFMEPVILQMLGAKTGMTIEVSDGELIQRGVIAGRIDGFANGTPVEIKNTTRNLGTDMDNMDRDYYMQVQGYIYILDIEWMWFCYLRNGNELVYFKVFADKEVQERIPVVAQEYLTALELDEMPEEPEKAKKEFSEDIKTNNGILLLLNRYAELSRVVDPLSTELEELKDQLKLALNGEEGSLSTSVAKITGYVTKRKGSLDTKQIETFFKANNMDIDMFRKEGSESYALRITVFEDEEVEEDLF